MILKTIFLALPIFSLTESVTDYAGRLDTLYHFLIGVSFLACALVLAGFIYFSFRYRRKSKDEVGQATVSHSWTLEILWSAIPFVIFFVAFAWGWLLYHDLKRPPKASLEIHVYGQMWNWTFVYKNGKKTTSEFFVPVNRPVKLIMTSQDVLHSFFIPSFRIKQDVIPGMYTSLWFKANRKGRFHVFCTEFCGTGHSDMLARLNVVSVKEWEEWMTKDPYKGLSLADIGKQAFKGRCMICHTTSEKKLIGPGLKGLYKSRRFFQDGSAQIADENYIRESILNPGAKIVSGFQNQMTPFAGLLSEEELTGLIEYIKLLK